nr:transporter substrate-binding domain-containing protein [Pantoea sp. 201603H]
MPKIALSVKERQALAHKLALRVGVAPPFFPPLHFLNENNQYQGISADYTQLIAQQLALPLTIKQYASREAALKGLEAGEIDMVSSSSLQEIANKPLLLSRSYTPGLCVTVARADYSDTQFHNFSGKKIALSCDSPYFTQWNSYKNDAEVTVYQSPAAAMNAVATGEADFFIGDALETNYLLNTGAFTQLRQLNLTPFESGGARMAFANDPILLGAVNRVLNGVPSERKQTILQYWMGEEIAWTPSTRIQLTKSEQQWKKKHPVIRAVINENDVPFTFYDGQGNYVGLSAEMMNKITQLTGLTFSVSSMNSIDAMIQAVRNNDADIIAAVPESEERRTALTFSNSYLNTPYALITRTDADHPRTLDDLNNHKLALMHGHQLTGWLRKYYPKIILVEVNSSGAAMEMVAKGTVSAAVNALLSARYMIPREYEKKLQTTSIVGDSEGELAFGMAKTSPELQAIINKALLSITPQEMKDISMRWQGKVIIQANYWRQYRSMVIQGFILTGVLLLFALLWIAGLSLSIRKRKQVERALNDQMVLMKVLIDGSPNPIYVRDRRGLLIHCNACYLQHLGVTREEAMGKSVLALAGVDRKTLLYCHDDYMRVMESGEPLVQDRVIHSRLGTVKTIYHWILPFSGSDGVVNGMIGGWIDVTERQQLLEHLREAKAEAEEANRAKTTFLATMSHEIRTPMNAIIGMLDMATRKAQKGEFDVEALNIASNAAHGLLDLIGDILDIAHIESGKFTLLPQRNNLRSLVDSVLRVFDGLANQKRIGLTLEVVGETDIDVEVDPLRFKQILSNIVSNAIKFTAQGAVHVCVQAERKGLNLELAIDVEDSGIGIPAEELPKLFMPFSQASNNLQSIRSGSGLGLVICKTLCEMMGGTLSLISEANAGTHAMIRLSLPVTIESQTLQEDVTKEMKTNERSLNILVIDDYLPNRLLLSQQLSWLGHQVTEADDGLAGLDMWQQGSFDVVITDCNMPGMNGYQLSDAIRQQEEEKGLKPVLILGFTANALSGEREHCIDAGMNDCMFKPLSLERLHQHLSQIELPVTVSPRDAFPEYVTREMDLSSLQRMAAGGEDDLRSLLTALSDAVINDLNDLANVNETVSPDQLAQLAHRIKGAARMVEAGQLVICCDNLESACQTAAKTIELMQKKSMLEGALRRFSEALTRYLASLS